MEKADFFSSRMKFARDLQIFSGFLEEKWIISGLIFDPSFQDFSV